MLASIPACLGALLLLAVWTQFGWNATFGAIEPRWTIRIKAPLGFIAEGGPGLDWDRLTGGAYQKAAGRRLGTLSMVHYTAVRWKNQLYYSLFGMSGLSNVIIGPDRQLNYREHVQGYCELNLAGLDQRVGGWARDLRRVQDALESRGVAFLYVTTPTKPGLYPETLPAENGCFAAADKRRQLLGALRFALDSNGVHYADSAMQLVSERAAHATALFPRGGAHWNALGAALAATAITGAVNQLAGRELLLPFRFTWTMSDRPNGLDRDLVDVLNLMVKPRYAVPVLQIASAPPAQCRPARVVEVGGSFLWGINDILGQTACPPEIREWYYWDRRHFVYPPGRTRGLPVDAAVRIADLTRDADVVILEENEQGVAVTDHARRLRDLLLGAPDAGGR